MNTTRRGLPGNRTGVDELADPAVTRMLGIYNLPVTMVDELKNGFGGAIPRLPHSSSTGNGVLPTSTGAPRLRVLREGAAAATEH